MANEYTLSYTASDINERLGRVLPTVSTADNNKVLTVADGVWAVQSSSTPSAEAPIFDLAAMGLPNIPYGDRGGAELETDTTEIMAALEKGEVTFKLNAVVSMDGTDVTMPFTVTANPILANGTYICGACLPIMTDLDCLIILVGEGYISAAAYPMSIGGNEGSGSSEAPIFDLSTDYGLDDIPYGDSLGTFVEADTTEIMTALSKGEVTFKVKANVPNVGTLPLDATVAPIRTLSPENGNVQYICGACLPMLTTLDCLLIVVQEGWIIARTYPMNFGGDTTPPTSIDLSGLESSGQIVETYADGSTKITQLEFDTVGNPTKITDGDGNVTTLIW